MILLLLFSLKILLLTFVKIENSVLFEYWLYMLPGLWQENAVRFKYIKACIQTGKLFIICVNFGLNFSILCRIICSKWTWLKWLKKDKYRESGKKMLIASRYLQVFTQYVKVTTVLLILYVNVMCVNTENGFLSWQICRLFKVRYCTQWNEVNWLKISFDSSSCN